MGSKPTPGHMMEAAVGDFCLEVRASGIHLQHRLSAHRWAGCNNMWPNDVLTFYILLGVQNSLLE